MLRRFSLTSLQHLTQRHHLMFFSPVTYISSCNRILGTTQVFGFFIYSPPAFSFQFLGILVLPWRHAHGN
jgi:hypothetical protein